MKNYKHSLIAFVAVVVLGTPWIISAYPSSTKFIDNIFGYIGKNYTAVFFQEVITIAQLQKKYDDISDSKSRSKKQEKVRIMIVPGHEPDFGGTEFGNVREREIVVELADELQYFFNNNHHYEVFVSRDKNSWNSNLEKYFKDNWDDITSFVKANKEQMIRLVSDGSVTKSTDGIFPNIAPQNVALRLYGINKWNNENKIDIAIHIHFNDYPRNDMYEAGKYNGFAIYIPEKQFSNSTTTRAIADTVFKRLARYNAKSNLAKENDGVVEEQDLIAVGSYNTSDAPSMLIEYGYIYEPQFSDPVVRKLILKDLAFQTYLGVQDFFGSGNDVSLAYDTLVLPYEWKTNIDKNNLDKAQVLALQSALILEGVYPPRNMSRNECPRTGKFGPCTISALTIFQNKYGIKDENNTVGEKTRKILNDRYSGQIR